MPQVDLETLVCGVGGLTGGDGKVSCETLIQPDPEPNLPPESISVSIQDYLAGAAPLTYDREDSAKESTNPKSHSHNPNVPNPTRSGSQRYASANLKANGPILGLPNKIKHVTCSTSRHRASQTSSRIFPKKKPAKAAAAGGKSAVPDYEPSSPKVSCIGKVLSDREREKCRLARRRRSPNSPGCWAGLVGLFACAGGGIDAAEEKDEVARGDILVKKSNIPSDEDDAVDVRSNGEAPGLGGMKRFASGRRAASWGGDGEGCGHVAVDLSRRSLDVGPVEA